jgi:putative acetyltransferase
MPMDLLIRDFKPGDEAALWDVFFTAIHRLAASDYNRAQLDAWAPAHRDLVRWATRMRQIAPFVAESEGKIVGYADLQADGYIDHFFVAPAFARRGVGSQIMQHILNVALHRGTGRLYSNVSITARPFFERWGFLAESPQEVTIQGVILRNFRMGKALGAAG